MARTLSALIIVSLVAVAAIASAQRASSTPPATAVTAKGLTAVDGLRVGHFTLSERPTGCTVVIVDGAGATGGVAQRGGAPGTRETDLLDPLNMVDRVNAIVLSGGSAYGLDAAQGVVRFLEEKGVGWRVGAAGVVPIVPAAILFDLGFGGSAKVRPTADCGYKAATAATNGTVQEGNVGAGAGATVGKMGGGGAMKAGIGTAARVMPNGLVVAAIVAVNAAGDIIDPESGRVVAGARTADGKSLADVRQLLRSGALSRAAAPAAGRNTTIGVVATNARLDKAQVSRMALMADDGLARAIAPSHTLGDGDTVFSLATGTLTGDANVSIIGALAADALAEAIVRAAVFAQPSGGLPAARDFGSVPERYRSAIPTGKR
jgi:L-aminopeptidase/D-esterase-like protein